MLGFDRDLRSRGFAGNSCQILLRLDRAPDVESLRRGIDTLARRHSGISARPTRRVRRYWKPTHRVPEVRVHPPRTSTEKLFNEPLAIDRGDLMRFDVIGEMVVFSWTHVLMDAKGAEYFLALVGTGATPSDRDTDHVVELAEGVGGCAAKLRLARDELAKLAVFGERPPRSLGTHRPGRLTAMQYRLEKLSAQETDRMDDHARRTCGLLGGTAHRTAAALVELHHLHQRLGFGSDSYVVPTTIGLRPKGAQSPILSNQVVTILEQYLPEELATFDRAAAAVRSRMEMTLRENRIAGAASLSHVCRPLPLWLYMRLAKRDLQGEFCSVFLGDTGEAWLGASSFLGSTVIDVVHVPAVTVPPGIGLVYYRSGGRLGFTFVHAAGTLTSDETESFVEGLRCRLQGR